MNQFLGNLSLRSKLILMSFIPIAGLMLFAVILATSNLQVLAGAARIQEVARFSAATSHLLDRLQDERGAAWIFVSSRGKKFDGQLRQAFAHSAAEETQFRPGLQAMLDAGGDERFRQAAETVLAKLEELAPLRDRLLAKKIRNCFNC